MGLDPATLTLISMGASAGMQAVGAEQSASAEASAANYQASVARNNQVIANQNATYAIQAGQAEEDQKRRQTAQVIGSERAAFGANGINPDTGSGVDVQSSSKEMGELDALTIRSNAEKTATGYKDQGMNFAAQAGLDQSQAQNALTAGNLNAFSDITSGASSVSSKWQMYQMEGAM